MTIIKVSKRYRKTYMINALILLLKIWEFNFQISKWIKNKIVNILEIRSYKTVLLLLLQTIKLINKLGEDLRWMKRKSQNLFFKMDYNS